MNKNATSNRQYFKYLCFIACVICFYLKAEAQSYPFTLPGTITASLNVETTNTEVFNNKLLGYNIEGFNTQLQKDFIKLVDPVTIRFPHGVFANFYQWQTDGYQNDSYDNGVHESTLATYACCLKGHINGIAQLNTEKKAANGGVGYDMMWTYSINFDDGPSSVARAQKDMGLGLEVKDIELGNEHFWVNQRALRTDTPQKYLAEASAVSAALKAAYPNIRVSVPFGWRRSQAAYNATIRGDGSYYDAITVHKYLGADPDIPGESNTAYQSLLTAKLELAEDVNWVRDTDNQNKPIWLTEWGVSAGSDVHGAACLGMADAYLFMAENQHIYDRANWFSFNRVLNAMVVVGSNREPVYPLQKRGYLMSYEILQDVLRDATLLNGTVTSSTMLTTTRGSVTAVNARAVTKNGNTSVVAINLTDKPVEFTLKFDNLVYAGSFKHEALVFDNVGVVAPIDYYTDPLTLIKQGTGAITLPPLSISKISNIVLDSSIKLVQGTIEAEAYRAGGEGVGYSDTTPTNTLNATAYTDGVDVGQDNGVIYVGDTQNGEWLKYDVNVLQDGLYNFDFLYAAASTGALISVEMDDVVLFDNHALAQTSSATDFQTSTKQNVALTQGLHVLKVNVQNAGFNLDKINVVYIAPPPAPTFVAPADGYVLAPGFDIEVEASTSLSPSEITSMALYIDDVLVRSITAAPFTWGYDGQSDTLLENMAVGVYTLKLVLTDNKFQTSETSITVNVQALTIQPFGGVPHTIPGTIQVEDYDLGGQGLAFSDSSPGNSGGAYRTAPGEDVDIEVGGSGFVVGSLSGNEYLRYTINVTEAGRYQMLVNYKTFSNTSKPFAANILPLNLSTSTPLFSAPNGSTTSGIRIITEGSVFQDYTSDEFDLDAGLAVLELRIPSGGAGPTYDYVTLNRLGSLSINEFDNTAINLRVYPVPSKDGRFNLSIPSKWKVYSILGTKIAEGNGDLVDISNASKGIYLLKTEGNVIKKILYR
ncbi:carbohydrate-binding domain-containing protein [Siansivirga zeaxanthinifaciens]|uniref:CBM6 domain-containing protein n=1 Tax=Siansivirga zeaxanthinifaciens CC-SAMT-1 TaxID=1454006 RepID=A0A0C5WD39_9FLAO|nr:carbohydrate-binding domain-containing protein [Siansivirga zeaxanthinifaciens]AJR04993.1 hypothetical protein AW14_13690 [Siansivirga zeaxanthinifaciens CC-SAMT-1]